jgi:hypothetical protein
MKKQILVSIDDNVLSHLLNVAQVRKMSGTGFTALDEFAIKILLSIKAGESMKHFSFKKEKGENEPPESSKR